MRSAFCPRAWRPASTRQARIPYGDDGLPDSVNARALVVGRSRLVCQCVPNGKRDIVIEISAWNRNLARE
jgi:hypothetical protein